MVFLKLIDPIPFEVIFPSFVFLKVFFIRANECPSCRVVRERGEALYQLEEMQKKSSGVNFPKILQAAFVLQGVNFTNILQAAFICADPKSEKKTVKLSSFLCFWDLRA